MPRSFLPRAFALAIAVSLGAFLLTALPAARADVWDLVKYENRDYVSIQNVADFYKLENVEAGGKTVFLRSPTCTIRGEAGSKELTINGVKFILSYELLPMDDKIMLSRIDLTKLVEPVLRPNRMRNVRAIRTIVLDPGHGGFDRGAVSSFGDEKTFALDVCLRVRELLLRRGFRVEMTRASDIFIPLELRAQFANRFRDGIFVCVHFNAGSPAGTGIETYTLAPRFVPSTDQDGPAVSDMQLCSGNIDDPENMALATAMHASLLNRLPMVDRGIKRARFWVLRECTIPAVLIEGGFLSNEQEASRIAQPAYRQAEAEAIVQAIANYQRATGDAAVHNGPILADSSASAAAGRSLSVPSRFSTLGVGGLSGLTTGIPGMGPGGTMQTIGSTVPLDPAAANRAINQGPTVVVPRQN